MNRDRFNLNAQTARLYSEIDTVSRPLIGITGNYGEQTCKLADGYYKQIVAAGGTPVIIPPVTDHATLLTFLNRIDGLLLSGGADINPLYCDEEPSPHLGGINAERDLPELLLCRLAANRQMPILGICRGIQTMAVALGGTVAQDINAQSSCATGISPSASAPRIKHSQDADRSEPTHSIKIEEGSILAEIYTSDSDAQCGSTVLSPLFVNTFHHQAVSAPGPHLRVSATAPDGVIEAIESSELKPFLGVQWHPECLGEEGLPLFRWLTKEARLYNDAQRLHDRILSLDTHCDTPMFFPQGVDFNTRDEKILVDLPKMTEGRLDATIMVCYLPQPKEDQVFSDVAPFPVSGPKAYADLIFDKIGEMAAASNGRVAIARTPDELLANKKAGCKSIMLGIENGLALEGDVRNVRYFQKRGVVYITLCHNGDNDLCDSARGTATHGGVSELGERVIHKMNELGLIVDLSHAAESSFYDALQISRKPIVCSHSSSRALCDHPRNLTDDQMRALAAKDGVCQITLYEGFLKKGTATILDAMNHLEHAIDVMGIDHVGLGTDFDGDGGILGLADASELTLFTRQLLKRRYSEADIEKIWGGNFLRVMRLCQQR